LEVGEKMVDNIHPIHSMPLLLALIMVDRMWTEKKLTSLLPRHLFVFRST